MGKNSFSVSSIPDSQILATDEDETDIVNILLTSNETDKIIIEEGKSPRPENHNEHVIRNSSLIQLLWNLPPPDIKELHQRIQDQQLTMKKPSGKTRLQPHHNLSLIKALSK